jgi:hypothetical protein
VTDLPGRLVSGGQTGVDRAALDVALALGIPCGGWCPRGRRAEDAPLPDRYPLSETPSAEYPQRTEWNVRDSDGTLVLAPGLPDGGTALTLELAERIGRPSLAVDPRDLARVNDVRDWLGRYRVRTLNVAGPRESRSPGAYDAAHRFLTALLGTG